MYAREKAKINKKSPEINLTPMSSKNGHDLKKGF
jgi:hypothetical protein